MNNYLFGIGGVVVKVGTLSSSLVPGLFPKARVASFRPVNSESNLGEAVPRTAWLWDRFGAASCGKGDICSKWQGFLTWGCLRCRLHVFHSESTCGNMVDTGQTPDRA